MFGTVQDLVHMGAALPANLVKIGPIREETASFYECRMAGDHGQPVGQREIRDNRSLAEVSGRGRRWCVCDTESGASPGACGFRARSREMGRASRSGLLLLSPRRYHRNSERER